MATCSQVIKAWEAKNEAKAADAIELKFCAHIPSISKMDNTLSTLKNCVQLSLSTNCIERIAGISGSMEKLKILSLGRNNIKKIEKLDEVAETLEQLWISYNEISSLDGLASLKNLTTLYFARNNIKSFSELDKIAGLVNLKDVVFIGNPMYENQTKAEIRIEIIKRLPQVTKIDGELVKPDERDLANGISSNDDNEERPESAL